MTSYELWEYEGCSTFILAVDVSADGRRTERVIARLEAEKPYDTTPLARKMIDAANRTTS